MGAAGRGHAMTATAKDQAPQFTAQQHRAVQTRQVSVSLSAGAGCGKTFVLTERYLSHLDPHDPQSLSPDQIGQLVAITFTDRAAREMRDRIRRRCYERLRSAEEADADYWAGLLRALDNARISTIHAFCASLLRSRAVEAGLDPQFAVLEQPQADTLLSEAVDDEVRRLISERDESTLELAVQFGLDGLRAMVRQFVLEATPQLLERWLDVSPEDVVERWVAFFAELRPTMAAQLANSAEARRVRGIFADFVPTKAAMRERRSALLNAFDTLSNLSPGDSLPGLLAQIDNNARVRGGGGASDWPSTDLYESFRDTATKLRKQVETLAGVATFDPSEAVAAAELGVQLLKLASAVYRTYDVRKTELRVLDFGDLLVRTGHCSSETNRPAWLSNWATRSRCCWSMNSRIPIRCRSSWSRPCAAKACRRASCSLWATTSNRSIVSAGRIPTCLPPSASERPRRAGRI